MLESLRAWANLFFEKMRMKEFPKYFLLILVTALNLLIGFLLLPSDVALPTQPLRCISYDPRYRLHWISDDDLAHKTEILKEWIDEDLNKISKISKCVRIYYVSHGMEEVPRIAKSLSMEVILGAYISRDAGENDREIQNIIQITRSYSNIRSIILGNEIYLNHMNHVPLAVDPQVLLHYLGEVRTQVKIPVSTGEPALVWMRNPELVWAVDFLAVNDFPYWRKIPLKDALDATRVRLQNVQSHFPNKKILLSETGWPSGGAINGLSVPGKWQMARYLNDFVNWANSQHIDYNYFEVFDQPWKMRNEGGRVESQWGLFDANGNLKLEKSHSKYDWLFYSVVLGFFTCLIFLVFGIQLNGWSGLYLFVSIQAVTAIISLTFRISREQYLFYGLNFWVFVVIPCVAMLSLVMIYLIETIEVIGGLPKNDEHSRKPDEIENGDIPFISIHVPCCQEDPDMVISTLRSLLALDYASYEIIVMDNNSTDKRFYEPVAEFCARHPEIIKFFHEDSLAGFKSGALNYALKKTDPRAEIIAVIDSDYVVSSDWLKDLAPLFQKEEIAVVQSPQAYRKWENKLFQIMMHDEYKGFFQIGMVQRNARNAIIQHGTMLLIRRSVLENVGKWGEWCIAEDTELGLRILMAGHRACYINKIYGEGLVPHSAEAYFKQRFRWVHGAMSIFRRYFKEFLGLKQGLTAAQRYFFIAGWLPWVVDVFVPLFIFFAIVGMAFCFYSNFYFPPIEFAYPFLAFFLFRFVTFIINYHTRVKIGWRRTLLSSIAGMALTWTIAEAVLSGLLGKKYPFYRTQKSEGTDRLDQNPILNRQVRKFLNLAIGFLLLIGGVGLPLRYGLANSDALVWGLMILLLALPIACKLFMSSISSQNTALKIDTYLVK
ncbi:MAG: bcsA [Bacteriovoracaceae bacterium]|nr:bcsA [Bacteriovoracaceae bacterium]